MLSLIPWLGRRLEFAAIPCIAFSFWALLVMVQITLQEAVIKSLVLGVTLVCCLLLLGFVSVHFWKTIGTPGAFILATMATYLVIGVAVLLVTDADLLQGKDVLRQVFFFLVTLAAMLGGRSLLERIGVEALLKWALVVLTASCAVILASPLLRDLGVLPGYKLARHPGTFSDPNNASFVACMTVALALAFQSNGRQRILGGLALVLGCGAGLLSGSDTAIFVLGLLLIAFLLLNGRRLRQNLWHTGLTVLGAASILIYLTIDLQLIALFQQMATPAATAADANALVQQLEQARENEDANALVQQLEQARENEEVIRGEPEIYVGGLLRRIGLWKIGFAKALASPLVGHGLYQLHYMEGAPLGYHGRPAGVHNLYLMLIGEAGIIPLALYLLWLFFLLRLRWRMPISLVRDSIFGWAVVMVLFSVTFQHLLAMGASNFLVGLSCALAAFLIRGRSGTPLPKGGLP